MLAARPPQSRTEQAAPRWELYRVLSEPIRLRVLALAAEEELAVGELAELLEESQPNVSRHVAALRQAGLLGVRKQGTRTFLRVMDESKIDLVVADAVQSGRDLCHADGSLGRIAEVLRARDAVSQAFFANEERASEEGVASELGAYLAAFAQLIEHRALAVDAGTGDGGLLDVIAPVFERVVALDRSEIQLGRATARIASRGYRNVELVHGDLNSDDVRKRLGEGADAVFASRLLHHAPRPLQFVKELASLCRPGGALVVIDYAPHGDEGMREQADLWLGFEASELSRFARAAGLVAASVSSIPESLRGNGRDRHLVWQAMVARRPRKDHKNQK